ncbi:MAG TPA: selenocysteine-specific translation elongation factor [Myxococcales bacterium]|nr:selenocysteine-specific translation elongation factor [Myxococcales bacterium]
MIVGTAGHIDHGKTSLVKALTGIDTDRLQEEKRRGITIELGFAHLQLPDGTVAGVVDVPGHERFVKAMVAGAGGVDLAVLVVAADEGVMPQTREHLDICRLLGVKGGVVAVTKSDLLPELGAEWMELLEADLRSLTQGTFLEEAAIVPCSAKTSQGLEDLKRAIAAVARSLPSRPSEGPVYLPVDRAFTVKGFGTVITGTLLSGHLALEEAVSLLPGLPGPLRVRGLQIHGQMVEKAAAGQRLAINVAGVEADAVSRGMALVRHDELPESRMLDVELTLLPAAEDPLPARRKLLLHLGTAQVEATVALLDRESLEPGRTCFAQLRLAAPLAALPEQHFILRGARALAGRGATLAGGRVLAVSTGRRRKGASEVLAPLVDAGADARVAWLLEQSGYRGLTARELFARSGAAQKQVTRALELLSTRGQAILLDKERRLYLSGAVFQKLRERALSLVEDFHAREPLKEGLPKEELRRRLSQELDPKLLARLLPALEGEGKVEVHGDVVRVRGKGRALTKSDEGDRARVVEELARAGLAPPRVEEMAQGLHLPGARVTELLKTASAEGLVVKVADDMYFDRRALDGLKEKLVGHLREHKEITTQAFKEMVGQTRKWVIPLSEYFDREKVTLRVGEKRVLRKG